MRIFWLLIAYIILPMRSLMAQESIETYPHDTVLLRKQQASWESFFIHYQRLNYDSAQSYASQCVRLSEQLNDQLMQGKVHGYLGLLHKKMANYDSALHYYEKSLTSYVALSDSAKIGVLYMSIGTVLRLKNDLKAAFSYYKQAEAIHLQLKDSTGLSKSYQNIGNYFYNLKNYDSAILSYNKSLALYERLNDVENTAKLYNNLGVLYWDRGYYRLAIQHYLQSLKVKEMLGLEEEIGVTQYNLALLYISIKDFDSAEKYFFESLKHFDPLQVAARQTQVFLGLGDLYFEKKDYTNALTFYKKSLLFHDAFKDPTFLARVYYGLGAVYNELRQIPEARAYLQKALDLSIEYKDVEIEARVYNGFGAAYFFEKDLTNAIKNYKRSLKLATQFEGLDLQMRVTDALAEAYEAQGNSKIALQYYRNYHFLNDSLLNGQKARQIGELKEQYESEIKDRRIAVLEKNRTLQRMEKEKQEIQLARNTDQRNALFWIFVAFAVLSVVLILFYRQRLVLSKIVTERRDEKHGQDIKDLLSRQETQSMRAMLAGEEKERKRLAGELHDHLGSVMATIKVNLNGLENVADLSRKPINQWYNRTNDLVSKAYEDIRSLSHQLNMGISKEFGLISALESLKTTLNQTGKIKVHLSTFVRHRVLSGEFEISIYRFIQELVSNVLRHAKAGNLYIYLTHHEDHINVMVEDDGVGFDIDQYRDGIGLSNIKETIDKMDGSIEIDSQQGSARTVVIIDLPIQESKDETQKL